MNESIGKQIENKIKNLRMKKGDVAKLFGVGERTLYNWTHEIVPIPKTKMKMVEAFISGDFQWGISNGLDNPVIVEEAKEYTPFKVVNVPLVSQYAYGGYLSGYADEEYISTLPTIPFAADREMTGNYRAFEVHGESMDDGTKNGFTEGEIVICREVEPYLWRDSKLHINKRDFVIVHEEGILIKRIIEHDVQNHKITIHSLNPAYKDRVIDLAGVKQIFSIVVSQVSRGR